MTTATVKSRNIRPTSIVVKEVANVPVPTKLLDGIMVTKVSTLGKMHERVLTLSDDKFTITISHKTARERSISSLRPILKKVTSLGSVDDEEENERTIDIGSIDRIQRGQNTHRFELARQRSDKSPRAYRQSQSGSDMLLDSSRSFSIIFRGERTLDLMAQPEDNRDEILDALDRVIASYQSAKVKAGNDVLLLRYIWLDVDRDHSNTVNVDELGNLLNRINFYVKKKELSGRYAQFARVVGLDKDSRKKGLTFDQCVTFMHKVKRDTWHVKPVDHIWKELFGEYKVTGEKRTTVSTGTFLQRFLHRKQGQYEADIDFVRKLFKRINRLEVAHVASGLSNGSDQFIDKNHFEAYLLSAENDAFDPRKEKFRPESLHMPLPYYWINSSHNTYLKGDQLYSNSSVEMYMNALYRGCRCVELDTHDGGDVDDPNPIPVVYHGHTLTSKINFSDIIRAIKVFLNFNPDSYPILLSLENHCSLRYQEVMAEDLTNILRERLYIPDESDLVGPLPSPEDLKGMVVIKGKRIIDKLEDDEQNDDDSTYWDSDGAYWDSDEDQEDDVDNSSHRKVELSNSQAIIHKHKIHPELSRITLLHGTSFKSFEESIPNPFCNHMHSFSETKVARIYSRNEAKQWKFYNQTHLSRTFPSGTRVASSNYNPVLAWSAGAQLVALNFQTPDAPLRVNDGRFRENGNCGYVLKPQELLQSNLDNNIPNNKFFPPPLRMTIRVLSATCLPKPKGNKRGECIDPYVMVRLYDVTDTSGLDYKKDYFTNTVSCNGFFPIWNSEDFFFNVENQTVAVLQLTVYDKDTASKDDFIASASIPVSCLRKGYRSVKLFDSNNTRSGPFDFASLLMEVKMEQSLQEI